MKYLLLSLVLISCSGGVDEVGAWAVMQQFVSQQLKSPSGADFPFGGSRHVTSLGGGRYRIDSYVNAQNSFGAKIRTSFTGVVTRIEGGWKLESLVFGS